MKQIFLGKPHQSIIDWINGRPPTPPDPPPTTRTTTRIWWSNGESDYSDCPSNNGTFDSSCFPVGKSNSDAVKVEFGSDVTRIDTNVFEDCSGLTSVTIPDSVKNIQEWAFSSCSSLMNVTIGNSVTSIGGDAFSYCSKLTSVIIPDSVIDIDIYAFCGCSSLASVIIGNGVTSIGQRVFQNCGRLTNVTFEGKDIVTVQGIDNYPWGIEDISIINVA